MSAIGERFAVLLDEKWAAIKALDRLHADMEALRKECPHPNWSEEVLISGSEDGASFRYRESHCTDCHEYRRR